MKEIGNLFDKYKDIKVVSDGTLFGADMRLATQKHVCPFCHCKLYLMSNRPMYYCRSKSHKNKFVISASKVIK